MRIGELSGTVRERMKPIGTILIALAALAALAIGVANAQSFTGTVQNHAIPLGKGPGVSGMTSLLPGAANTLVVSNGAAADPSYKTVTVILDAFCATQGAILYRNATDWVCLPPGQTGQPLMTGGAAANPFWGLAGSSGGVPYFSASARLSGSATLAANRIVFGGGAATQPGTGVDLGTTTTVLHGNAAGLPSWGAVSLTADVSGTLPVGSGGTGITGGTSGGVPYYSGASTIASSGALTANRLVLGGGAGAAPSTPVALGTTSTVLHGNAAGAPSFAAVELSTTVTGTLSAGNGGTGTATVNQGDLLFGSTVAGWDRLAKNTSATRYLSNTGTSNGPAWDQVELTTGAKDYAEGSWTPTLIGSSTAGSQTYTVQVGRYVRVGNSVTAHGRVTISAKDGAMAGNALVGGLPFTSRNVTNLLPSCSIGFMSNFNLTAGYHGWSAFVINNATTISLNELRVQTSGASQALPVGNVTATSDIIISCEYLIN